MRRIDFDYVVIFLLLLTGVYVFLTGLIADLMGLNRFAYHPTAGYVFMALTACHLILNWKRIVGYLRVRFPALMEGEGGKEKVSSRGGITRRDVLFAALGAAGGFGLGNFFTPGGEGDDLGGRDLARLYHRWSSFGETVFPGSGVDWGSRPAQYKVYPEAPRVPLPDPAWDGELTVGKAIEERRSERRYGEGPLPAEDLSRLLHAMQGITDQGRAFRAAPSAGALYPIEVYAVIKNVEGLEQGVYHYAVRKHELERLKAGDFSQQVMAAGAMQAFVGDAQACFILTAIFQRLRWKYRERSYRYALLEAGHIAQNLYLASTSLGLGCCAVGAFRDGALNELVGIGKEGESSLYLLPVGT